MSAKPKATNRRNQPAPRKPTRGGMAKAPAASLLRLGERRSQHNKGRRVPVKPAKPKASPRWAWQSLSAERKVDIFGVIMTLVGLLTLLALLSSNRSTLTGLWVDTLVKLAGWGTFVLPIALIALGLWLVFRHVERLPALSIERVLGVLLLFINIETWLHLLAGGGWQLVALKQGGGILGAMFERLLVEGTGKAGAMVILIAWLVIALAMTLDLSVLDLFSGLRPLFTRLGLTRRKAVQVVGQARQAELFSESGQSSNAEGAPLGFKPFTPGAHPFQSRKPPLAAQGKLLSASQSPGESAVEEDQVAADEAPILAAPQPWQLPQIESILDPAVLAAVQTSQDTERAHKIEETLASFGVPAHVVEIHRGPTVTQFGVEPDFVELRGGGRTRVRVAKIVALVDDLALALAAQRIRIQAPVPGRNYVGIEVPNSQISKVALREVMESEGYTQNESHLRIALGKDVAGKPITADLTALPHLLIAGTTGSGKSVCVNSILSSFLLTNSPYDLRLVLVDPKRVELTGYNGIPHLLAPVVVDAERVVGALQWMLREMDNRYHRFSRAGVRNIAEFNARFPDQHLPYLVVVIDELADLMMLAPDETEKSITRLAQLSRATGIHLILATQRPSVDVVTGLIKANFPARIAFAVASGVDSRVILDQPGAERLLGRGDMLYQAPDASAPVRLQGVYVGDSEIQRLVEYWRMEAVRVGTHQPLATGAAVDSLPIGTPLKQGSFWEDEDGKPADPLYKEAVELVRKEDRASITMLQRRMRIGYTRAARLIDAMEDNKIIAPAEATTQVRAVLNNSLKPDAPEEG